MQNNYPVDIKLTNEYEEILKNYPEINGIPNYETEGAAGFDVRAAISEPIVLKPMQRALVPTGVMVALPPATELQARPKSGLSNKHGISIVNAPGTIDEDYRGECKANLINLGDKDFVIEPMMRIAQFVMAPVLRANFNKVDELSETKRGTGGHGSTGVK